MRKNLFTIVTSYPFLLLSLIACFFAQSSFGQQLADGISGYSVSYLYDWCKALPVHDMFLPVLALRKGNVIPGPVQISAGQLSNYLRVTVNTTDSLITGINEADSSESKEVFASNQSLPVTSAPVIETPSTEAVSKPSSKLSRAIFDEETDMLVSKYAEMICIAPEEVNNFRLYKFIDNWYGVKYKWGGYDQNGIDCSGFTQKLYTSLFGVTIERTAKQQHKNCEIVKDYSDASEGDLVFFRIHHLGVSHVGVYLANGYFIHASRSRGVTISNLDDKYWRRRYAGCGRIERGEITGSESGAIQ